MHLAEAVPTGAKQFGKKTADKAKIAEIIHDFKKAQEQNAISNNADSRDKGFKATVEKSATVKKDQVNNEIKKLEQQIAIKTWESLYKKSWSGKN